MKKLCTTLIVLLKLRRAFSRAVQPKHCRHASAPLEIIRHEADAFIKKCSAVGICAPAPRLFLLNLMRTSGQGTNRWHPA